MPPRNQKPKNTKQYEDIDDADGQNTFSPSTAGNASNEYGSDERETNECTSPGNKQLEMITPNSTGKAGKVQTDITSEDKYSDRSLNEDVAMKKTSIEILQPIGVYEGRNRRVKIRSEKENVDGISDVEDDGMNRKQSKNVPSIDVQENPDEQTRVENTGMTKDDANDESTIKKKQIEILRPMGRAETTEGCLDTNLHAPNESNVAFDERLEILQPMSINESHNRQDTVRSEVSSVEVHSNTIQHDLVITPHLGNENELHQGEIISDSFSPTDVPRPRPGAYFVGERNEGIDDTFSLTPYAGDSSQQYDQDSNDYTIEHLTGDIDEVPEAYIVVDPPIFVAEMVTSNKKLRYTAIATSIILATGIGLGFGLSQEPNGTISIPPTKNTSSSSPDTNMNPPTSQAPKVMVNLSSALQMIFDVSGDTVQNDVLSPQYKAMSWLKEGYFGDDQNMIDIDTLFQNFALATLHYATNGENWVDDYNFLTPEKECNWNNGIDQGIFCENEQVRIIKLSHNGLQGSLPMEIGLLKHMNIFEIIGSEIESNLPDSIGNLTDLHTLQIAESKLSGMMPPTLGKLFNLEKLHLGINHLTGSIPTEIGNLVNLTELDLYQNELTGSIPESIGNLKQLQVLDFSISRLSGSIPEAIGNLTNLISLFLQETNMIGTIPESIGNLIQLEILDCYGSRFSSRIPRTIGNLIHLRHLYLYPNQVTGKIPESIGNLNQLEGLDFSFSRLSGSIPETIGNLINLKRLYLQETKLTGTIPESIGNLRQLEEMPLYETKIIGTIPKTIENLINLKILFLDKTGLVGTIPETIGNLTNLKKLHLQDTELTGTIPESIGNLIHLEELMCSRTKINGAIPESIGKIIKLKDLICSQSQLSGPIPETIGNLTDLVTLSLWQNNFSKTVPDSIGKLIKLSTLRLNQNQFTGTLPEEISCLKNLAVLDISRNFLSGSMNDICYELELHEAVADCGRDASTAYPRVRCDCCTQCCNSTLCTNIKN